MSFTSRRNAGNRICLLVLTFLVSCFGHAAASDFWVDSSTGSDTNNGGFSTPFGTIQKAADTAQYGDVIHVKSGVYREQVTVSATNLGGNGSTSNRLIIRKWGPTKPIIKASVEITSGWTVVTTPELATLTQRGDATGKIYWCTWDILPGSGAQPARSNLYSAYELPANAGQRL